MTVLSDLSAMQFKWVTYKIDDAGLDVVVDQLGAASSSYDQFLAVLPEGQCRYAGGLAALLCRRKAHG
jgi:hypothetical protein